MATSTKIEKVVYKLLTTSTGSALCDSGDAYGRHWQQNQKKTLNDFKNEPEASLEISEWTNKDGVKSYDLIPRISLFHKLVKSLDLDEVCEIFNRKQVKDWEGKIYGVSAKGQDWLDNMGFEEVGESFNSYNWNANFSQTIQGQNLEFNGKYYVLLQIHQGCDVRGGYTDAKLFLLGNYEEDCWKLLNEDSSYSYGDGENENIDFFGSGDGEFSNNEGFLHQDDLNLIAQKIGAKTINGYLF
jgi:hypothetical protein